MTLNWRHSREEYRWLAALVALTLVALLGAGWASLRAGLPAYRILYVYFVAVFQKADDALLLAGALVLLRALVLRTLNPFAGLWTLIATRFRSPALALAGVGPILIVPVLMASFGTLKMLMPVVRDFGWDDRLAAADRLLFFGYQPWQLTHYFLGSPFLTHFVDAAYSNWVPLLYTAVLAYALLAPRYERARFFLSFASAWVLIGVVGAYLLASAGPCYAQALGAVSAPEFAPLMAKLKLIHQGEHPLNSYYWQEVLWRHHSRHEYGFAMGVSAMPSMHNAIAILYALTASRVGKLIQTIAWTYAALIFVGSVHLGWHYAVDGIAAGLMMWGIWVAAGKYLDRVGYTRALAGGNADEPGLPDLSGEPVTI